MLRPYGLAYTYPRQGGLGEGLEVTAQNAPLPPIVADNGTISANPHAP